MFSEARCKISRIKYFMYSFVAFNLLNLIVISNSSYCMPFAIGGQFFESDPEKIILEICWNDVSDAKKPKYTEIMLNALVEKGYLITKGDTSKCGFKEFYRGVEDPVDYMKNRCELKNYSSGKFDAFMLFEASYKDGFIRFWLLDLENNDVILEAKSHCWLKPCPITTYTNLDRHKSVARTYVPRETKNTPGDKINALLARFPVAKSRRNDFYSREYKIDSVKSYNKLRNFAHHVEIRLACIGYPSPKRSHQMNKREKEYRKLWNHYLGSGGRYLKDKIKGKNVYIKCYEFQYNNKNHQSIIIGEVLLDNENLSLNMLKSGMVVFNASRVPDGIDLVQYMEAQRAAKSNGVGVWSFDKIKKIDFNKLLKH